MMSVCVAVTYNVEGVTLKHEHALDSWDGTYVAAQARRLVLAAFLTTSGSVVVKKSVAVVVVLMLVSIL